MQVGQFPASAASALIEGYCDDFVSLAAVLAQTLEQMSTRNIPLDRSRLKLERIERGMREMSAAIHELLERGKVTTEFELALGRTATTPPPAPTPAPPPTPAPAPTHAPAAEAAKLPGRMPSTASRMTCKPPTTAMTPTRPAPPASNAANAPKPPAAPGHPATGHPTPGHPAAPAPKASSTPPASPSPLSSMFESPERSRTPGQGPAPARKTSEPPARDRTPASPAPSLDSIFDMPAPRSASAPKTPEAPARNRPPAAPTPSLDSIFDMPAPTSPAPKAPEPPARERTPAQPTPSLDSLFDTPAPATPRVHKVPEHKPPQQPSTVRAMFEQLERERRGGTLFVRSGRLTLAFELVSGCITQSASDHMLANERLGDLLVERGSCTRERMAAAIVKANTDQDHPLGETLVREGAVSNRQIVEALELQVQRRVLRACALQGAEFEFTEGEVLPGDGRVQVAPSAMLRGK